MALAGARLLLRRFTFATEIASMNKINAVSRFIRFAASLLPALLLPQLAFAAGAARTAPTLFGFPVEFFLFGAILLGIALFHNQTFRVAVIGVSVIIVYKLIFTGFAAGPGIGRLSCRGACFYWSGARRSSGRPAFAMSPPTQSAVMPSSSSPAVRGP